MTTGRDFYAAKFTSNVEKQARWLRYGAEFKTESIMTLCAKSAFIPNTILEVGAGTGAVISELRRRGFGAQHIALDYSSEALAFLKTQEPEIATICEDITRLSNLSCDLVVCTHVLEHLESPDKAVKEIRDHIDARYYLFEVPLEDLPLGRLRNSGEYRAKNPAGHVQFYNETSFRKLLSPSFDICCERIYYPRITADALAFSAGDISFTKRAAKYLTQRVCPLLFRALWTRFWYAHMAVLAKRRIS